ncbi:MAG: hypothetical protein KY438_07305 [Actinobacteria bacterium]|nr:hypothetical protein [Actinomycetota bacterium]
MRDSACKGQTEHFFPPHGEQAEAREQREAVARAIVDALGRRAEVVHVPPTLRWLFAVIRHLPRPVFRRLPL